MDERNRVDKNLQKVIDEDRENSQFFKSFMRAFGRLAQQRRLHRRMTRVDLAELLDIPADTIEAVETFGYNCDAIDMAKLMQFFDIRDHEIKDELH